MSKIRLVIATCVQRFRLLSASLSAADQTLAQPLDGEALDDEFGRFRVWSANLGGLQKGHSSLDYVS